MKKTLLAMLITTLGTSGCTISEDIHRNPVTGRTTTHTRLGVGITVESEPARPPVYRQVYRSGNPWDPGYYSQPTYVLEPVPAEPLPPAQKYTLRKAD